MLPADAAGGHCVATVRDVPVRDVPSPSRRREVKIAWDIAAEAKAQAVVRSGRGQAEAGGGPSLVLVAEDHACRGPDGDAGGLAPTSSEEDTDDTVAGDAEVLPGQPVRGSGSAPSAGQRLIELAALERLQHVAHAPFETMFADPPDRAERLPICNLNTGETRYLGHGGDATESFLEGKRVLDPRQVATAGRPLQPWRDWWSEKRQKDRLLFRAAEAGDVLALREALSPPIDGSPPSSVNARCPDGRTALHAAVAAGHQGVVAELLDAGANVDARAEGGVAPVHLASTQGQAGVLHLLLEARADLYSKTAEGNLGAHLAAMRGHPALVRLLLDRGGAHQLSVRNEWGQRPAEACTDIPTARFLRRRELELGAGRAGADSYAGRTPFGQGGILLRNSRADVVRRLLLGGRQGGAAPEARCEAAFRTVEEPASRSPSPGSIGTPIGRRATTSSGAGLRTPSGSSTNLTPRVVRRAPFVRIRPEAEPTERVGPNSFEVVRLLGRGSFGEVWQVKHKRTEEVYAMKVLMKSKIMTRNLQRYAMTERNILAYVRHPYIVSLHYAFQDSSCLVLVLQYCSRGNLQHLISRERRLQEPLARLYTAEILLALCHLHERNTIFRDLKPDNVVIDELGHSMLTDFGLSKEGIGPRGTRSFCGSVAFLAPEILARREHGHTVDVYNLGVLLFDMLTGLPPFYHHDRETLFANIRHARLEVPRYVSPPAKALIEALMEREPTRRMGAVATADIQTHPFFATMDFGALFRREVPVPGPATAADLPREVALRPPSSPLMPRRGNALESPFSRQDRAARRSSLGSSGDRGSMPGWEFAAVPSAAASPTSSVSAPPGSPPPPQPSPATSPAFSPAPSPRASGYAGGGTPARATAVALRLPGLTSHRRGSAA